MADSKPKILVVEDERVVATDIENCLTKLGYTVVGSAASGPGAIRCAVETEPDLVLMDIKLKGAMDGVDAAGELHGRLGIPVVFLTAYADREILERAKQTSPSGYVLKPFDERALRSAVELALDRHPKERQLIESERRLVTALRGLGEGVILTRNDGRIAFMNRVAEHLTGWKQADAAGKRFSDVFATVHARMGSLIRDPVARVLREKSVLGLGDQTLLLSKRGCETWIEGSASPLRDESGEVVGVAVIFHPISRADDASRAPDADLPPDRWRTLTRIACGMAESLAQALETVAQVCSFPEESDSGEVCETAKKARELAVRFLDLARPRIPKARRVDLEQLLSESYDLLSYIADHEVRVETKPCSGFSQAWVDPVLLQQVLLDLAAGWRRWIPFGGTITIGPSGVELLAEYACSRLALAPGLYATLSVSFAGPLVLVPPENSRQEAPPAGESIREAGGALHIEHEPGRRLTFEIYLPAALPGEENRS